MNTLFLENLLENIRQETFISCKTSEILQSNPKLESFELSATEWFEQPTPEKLLERKLFSQNVENLE